jgi:aldose 1-epimerase
MLPVLFVGNLSGNYQRNVFGQRLQLNCDRYLPVSETQIPTGELAAVQQSPFDFTAAGGRALGEAIPLIDGGGRPGVDHCFVVNTTDGDPPALFNGTAAVSSASLGLGLDWAPEGFSPAPIVRLAGTLMDDVSGRLLVIRTSQPGVQVYTANWLSTEAHDAPHTQYNAVCLETQHFPDSPNQPHFPSTALRPGAEYRHRAVFSFKTVS